MVMLTAAAVFTACPASAQSLVEMYRSARFRVQAQQLERSGQIAPPLPAELLPYVSDSVRSQMAVIFPRVEPEAAAVEEPIRIDRWSLTPKLAGSWFEETFKDTRWSYLGSNDLAAYDTTFTRELRARMEEHFGAPTRTIADRSLDDQVEYIQFQYWFVLNDSIPMMVMDTNGPFERGVVVATDHVYRDILPDLKRGLLGPLMESRTRAPYVDYYYLEEQNLWFLTGFDGDHFFVNRISRPNLQMGRPLMSTVRDR